MSLKIDISVCRVCCKSDAPHSILKYAKKFHYCTSIEVAENDGLPDKICEQCLERMKLAVEFKKKSEFSDRQLKCFIKNVNHQFMALEGSSSGDLDCDVDEEVEPVEPPTPVPEVPEKVTQKQPMVVIPKNSALGYCPEDVEQAISEESASEPEPEPEAATETDVIPSPTPEPDPEPEPPQPEQEPEKFRAVAVIQEKPTVKPEKDLYEVVELEYEDHFLQQDEEDVMEVEEQQPEDTVQHTSTNGSESGEQVIYIGFTTEYQDQEEDDSAQNSVSVADSTERREELTHTSEVSQSYRQESFVSLAGTTSPAASSPNKSSPGGGKFECLECSKSFSTKTNLNRHVQSHNGNKPFICPLCNKGFTQGGSLKQHLLIHQNLRPFVCPECDQGFTQQKSLTFHMRRHTNEKPFVCPHCAYAFRQKDGLKRHLLVKHTEGTEMKLFDCDLCGKRFKTRYAQSVHRRRHETGLLSTPDRPKGTSGRGGSGDCMAVKVEMQPEVSN